MYQIHSNVDRKVREKLEGFYWAWGEETDILTFYESPQHFQGLKKGCGFSKIQLLFKTNFSGKFSH